MRSAWPFWVAWSALQAGVAVIAGLSGSLALWALATVLLAGSLVFTAGAARNQIESLERPTLMGVVHRWSPVALRAFPRLFLHGILVALGGLVIVAWAVPVVGPLSLGAVVLASALVARSTRSFLDAAATAALEEFRVRRSDERPWRGRAESGAWRFASLSLWGVRFLAFSVFGFSLYVQLVVPGLGAAALPVTVLLAMGLSMLVNHDLVARAYRRIGVCRTGTEQQLPSLPS
jgi:hypothetical protein